jgi:hypothetical protein
MEAMVLSSRAGHPGGIVNKTPIPFPERQFSRYVAGENVTCARARVVGP